MNYLDYVIIGVLTVAFILGFKDGLIRKLIGLAGVIIGIILAVKLAAPLGALVSPLFDNEKSFAQIAAGLFVFIIVILLASIIKRIVHPHDKVNKMVNQVLGGVIGILQIAFFLSAALYLLGIFNVPEKKAQNQSLLYSSIYSVVPRSVDLIIGSTGGIDSILKDKKNKTKEKVVNPDQEDKNLKTSKNLGEENKTKKIKKVSDK